MGATIQPSASTEQVAIFVGVFGGIEVRARCYAVEGRGRSRYEVSLEASGQRAVVDVPRGPNGPSELDLQPIVERAMEMFAESLLARR